jgi:hypothetical protein
MGGFVNYQTDISVVDSTPHLAVPGLLSYNMTSGEFSNHSTTDFGGQGNLIGGASHFLPFGPNGLLIFMGGAQGPVLTTYEGWTEVDFNNLHVYDPKGWYIGLRLGTS